MPRAKTGHPNGADHYEAKLNAEVVREIRADEDFSPTRWVEKLEDEHGIFVSPRTVSLARRGRTWKHVS